MNNHQLNQAIHEMHILLKDQKNERVKLKFQQQSQLKQNILQQKHEKALLSVYNEDIETRVHFVPTGRRSGSCFDKSNNLFISQGPYPPENIKNNIDAPQRYFDQSKQVIVGQPHYGITQQFKINPNDLTQKEKSRISFWERQQGSLKQQQLQEILQSTGAMKKISQSERLNKLRVFRPSSLNPSVFEKHPSYLNEFARSGDETQRAISISRLKDRKCFLPQFKCSKLFEESSDNLVNFIESKSDKIQDLLTKLIESQID